MRCFGFAFDLDEVRFFCVRIELTLLPQSGKLDGLAAEVFREHCHLLLLLPRSLQQSGFNSLPFLHFQEKPFHLASKFSVLGFELIIALP